MLKKSKWTIESYRTAVDSYRNAQSKEEKRAMERLIDDIKSDFRSEISRNDPKVKKLRKLSGELFKLTNQGQLFELSKREKAAWNKRIAKLTQETRKLEAEIEAIKANKIYENAFEWRFEFPEVLNDQGEFVGFEVVIGNPPYIRQEELKDLKPYLQEQYRTYAGTADMYVFFVERGLSILRSRGQFIYILPNKWMRAGYGDKLRNYLQEQNIESIIDFGDLPVFEEATTYPCIMRIEKAASNYRFESVEIESLDFEEDLASYVREHAFEVDSRLLQPSGWTLTDVKVQKLLEKLRDKGVPLGEYVEGKIFYGIKTGLNEAFVIDRKTRDRLIAEDPNSAEIIKPFLAGRDIKRYLQPESEKYLIFTRRGIDIQRYPAVLKHLEGFRARLEPRPKTYHGKWKGRKAGSYTWHEIQDNIAYYKEFEKEKVVLAEIALQNQFTLDTQGLYYDTTAFIIPEASRELLGILNSRLILFYFSKISSQIRGGYYRWKRQYLEQLPIVTAFGASRQSELTELVKAKLVNPKDEQLEAEIDQLVYELYDLTEEEIKIIENT